MLENAHNFLDSRRSHSEFHHQISSCTQDASESIHLEIMVLIFFCEQNDKLMLQTKGIIEEKEHQFINRFENGEIRGGNSF